MKSTKLYTIILILIYLNISVYAQCTYNFPTETSQEDLNTFEDMHPDCEVFEGDILILGDSTLIDLSPFSNLTKIEGSLSIYISENLKSLEGLHNIDTITGSLTIGLSGIDNFDGLRELEYVGGEVTLCSAIGNFSGLNQLTKIDSLLSIRYCDNIKNLNGLENLKHCGGITISDNDSLINLVGLSGLLTAKNIHIYDNEQIQNLEGLSNLQRAEAIKVTYGNDSFKSFEGLVVDSVGFVQLLGNEVMSTITGLDQVKLCENLAIGENSNISDLSGIADINRLGGLSIFSNSSLENLETLSGLDSLHDFLTIRQNQNLISLKGMDNLKYVERRIRIYQNPNLVDLGDFKNLCTTEDISICENPSLIDINTFPKLVLSNNSFVLLEDNPLLHFCGVDWICNFFSIAPSNTRFTNNSEGCNSFGQVFNSCVSSDEEIEDLTISLYPNPTGNYIYIDDLIWEHLEVLSISGKPIIQFDSYHNPINISQLVRGTYLINIKTGKSLLSTSVIKK